MNKKKNRIPIPTETRRQLLVDCGFKCSITICNVMQNLQAHHINTNPSDNRLENIIMLCPTHHTMADRGTIDRKSCRMYKAILEKQRPPPYDTILKNIELIHVDVRKLSNHSKKSSKKRGKKK